jgi:hypothetical protein
VTPRSDNATDTWKCPISDGAYCAGDSLTTPVVILCTNGTGTPGNCIPHNWSRPPADVHYSQCYESSPTAGDAACAKSCTVYPDSGFPFPVPGSCNATALNQVDVTNGAVATTCREGMLPNSNKTGTICDSSAPSLNGTANGHNFNSTNGTSPTVHDPTKTSSKGAASPTETGAAVALGVGPMIGYAVLGLLAFTL